MKGSKTHRQMAAAHQPVKPAPHLSRRCPGEGHYKNITRSHTGFFYEPLRSPGNHKGLSRTGAGQYKHRSPVMFNCFFLGAVYLHASSFSMALRILAKDSSLPMTSIISVAPAGVICLPETAVRIGHITYPFL